MRTSINNKETNIIERTMQFVKDTLGPCPERYDMTYRYEHTLRVATIGCQIAQKEQLNTEALVIACLLHDIGYAKCKTFEEMRNHAEFGEIMAREFLKELTYPQEQIEEICNAILIHDGDCEILDHTPNAFELSVRDADDIDRWDAMRLGIIANSIIGEKPSQEVIEGCEKKLQKLQWDLKRGCGTKTAESLWKERVSYQIEYFTRLIRQMQQTKWKDELSRESINPLGEQLQLAINQWALTDVTEIMCSKDKVVYAADSMLYGTVILKENHNRKELSTESKMLSELQGDGCCKIYDYDERHGLLLEERILPGNVLREDENLEERVRQFLKVFSTIHFSNKNIREYPTYLEWLDNAYDYCIKNQQDNETLQQQMKLARKIGYEMFEKYPERVLLHGDLHHDNMLKNQENTYVMIDPKGVIGPEIFDLPRYLLNELDPDLNSTGARHIQTAIGLIRKTLSYSIRDISRLFYMEVLLGNVWCLEDGEEMNAQDITVACEIIYQIQLKVLSVKVAISTLCHSRNNQSSRRRCPDEARKAANTNERGRVTTT